MAWIPQPELDAAVDALTACASAVTTHDTRRLRIMHPAKKFTRRRWEALICGMLASTMEYPDATLPDGTYLIYHDAETI